MPDAKVEEDEDEAAAGEGGMTPRIDGSAKKDDGIGSVEGDSDGRCVTFCVVEVVSTAEPTRAPKIAEYVAKGFAVVRNRPPLALPHRTN